MVIQKKMQFLVLFFSAQKVAAWTLHQTDVATINSSAADATWMAS